MAAVPIVLGSGLVSQSFVLVTQGSHNNRRWSPSAFAGPLTAFLTDAASTGPWSPHGILHGPVVGLLLDLLRGYGPHARP